MVKITFILLFITHFSQSVAQEVIIKSPLRYLAFGDSYTIGQSVSTLQRWPNQLVDSLKKYGVEIDTFGVIAQTGWRTDNLLDAMNKANLSDDFNLVSLLIGVNDQYQGLSTQSYQINFTKVLIATLDRVKWDKSAIFVLSIPDYGYTPFGQGNQPAISNAIDNFNAVNRSIVKDYGITYFDITPVSRLGFVKPEYVATDGLHPSGVMYTQWVRAILNRVRSQLGTNTDKVRTQNGIFVHSIPNLNKIIVSPMEMRSTFYLYNGSGQLILNQNLNAGQSSEITVNSMSSGLYLYSIKTNAGFLQTGKLFISK